jgi:hypothetical protein
MCMVQHEIGMHMIGMVDGITELGVLKNQTIGLMVFCNYLLIVTPITFHRISEGKKRWERFK